MKDYQSVLYSITLTGFLCSRPLLCEPDQCKKQAEFFVKVFSNSVYLNRVFVSHDDAKHIRENGYLGAKLFVDGDVVNYLICKTSSSHQVIPEIQAKKIWILNAGESTKHDSPPGFTNHCAIKADQDHHQFCMLH